MNRTELHYQAAAVIYAAYLTNYGMTKVSDERRQEFLVRAFNDAQRLLEMSDASVQECNQIKY